MSEKRALRRSLLLRLSDELYARVDAAALNTQQSAAGWVRVLVADALRARAPVDRKRSPRRIDRPELSCAEAEMKAVVRALGTVGGAIVQLCKVLREADILDHHSSAEQVLLEVRGATEEARKLVRKIGI
jgi:hypothetical protein